MRLAARLPLLPFCRALVLVGLGWFVTASAVAQNIPTNAEILQAAMAASVDSVAMGQKSQRIYIETSLPPDVRASLQSDLLERGYRLSASADSSAWSLRFEPMVRFRYERTSKRAGARTADGHISMTLIAPDGNIMASKAVPVAYADVVGPDPDALDDGTWAWSAFSEVERGRRGFFRKIAEPALIASAVSVTIYLLFNVRSQ